MSTYVDVEISPDTTTRPVFTRVSQATRPVGSAASTASRTPSEIWSAILSGWPSVTDSDVNRYPFSSIGAKSLGALRLYQVWVCLVSRAALALDEVDDHRDALEAVALAQAVFDEVRVVPGDALARVDLDREARGILADLGDVEHLQAVALLGRRLALLHDVGEEAVELRRRDAVARAVGDREHLGEQALDVAPALGARGQHPRALAELVVHPRALGVELGGADAGARAERVLVAARDVPLVQDDRRRAVGLHREIGDAEVLGGHTVLGVAHDERDVGSARGLLGAQARVVLDGLLDLRGAADAR